MNSDMESNHEACASPTPLSRNLKFKGNAPTSIVAVAVPVCVFSLSPPQFLLRRRECRLAMRRVLRCSQARCWAL